MCQSQSGVVCGLSAGTTEYEEVNERYQRLQNNASLNYGDFLKRLRSSDMPRKHQLAHLLASFRDLIRLLVVYYTFEIKEVTAEACNASRILSTSV